MSDLRIGMLVEHASLGVGRVVALEPTVVHVFFATSRDRLATKLRLPMAGPLLTPSSAADAWLASLAFSFDAKSGRYARADTRLSRDEAVERFLEVFPQGFADPSYAGEGKDARARASKWRRAHEAFVESLGNGQGEKLLEERDLAGLAQRVRGVERHVRTLQGPEKSSLADALEEPKAARKFFVALFELLGAREPEQSRFAALCAAAAELAPAGPAEAAWPLVTLLPFVAQPDRHVILRPKLTCDAAERLGLELRYEPSPNARTYASLLASAELLLESLRPLGARDYIDVEAFMHASTSKAARPKPPLRLVT